MQQNQTEQPQKKPVPVNKFDPRFVQVSRREAAAIIGRSPTEFDRLRKKDKRCPKGYKTGEGVAARVMFRLSEVYRYSEALLEDAKEGEDTPPSRD
ncbi:hypothetical protein [Marinobacter sp. NFXS9]|uniref:hypothetical protein n=1 Tax=Marinobacter sp. NFXS9 TaxID=2818433 RepID=UPI0032E04E78